MRNPVWVRDEIILAMDLYVRAGRKQLPPSHEGVVWLSQLLNRLPIHPKSLRGENFRNPNGISMILGNFLGIDPQLDQPGLSRNNQLQASIWREFIENPSLLHRTAEAIEAPSPSMTPTRVVRCLTKMTFSLKATSLRDSMSSGKETGRQWLQRLIRHGIEKAGSHAKYASSTSSNSTAN